MWLPSAQLVPSSAENQHNSHTDAPQTHIRHLLILVTWIFSSSFFIFRSFSTLFGVSCVSGGKVDFI